MGAVNYRVPPMADEAESYGTYQLRRVPTGDGDTDLEKFTDQSVHGYSFSADKPSLSARSEVIRKSLEVLQYDDDHSLTGVPASSSPYKKDLHTVFEMLQKTNLVQGPKEQENLLASLRRFQLQTDGNGNQPSSQDVQQKLSKALYVELEPQRSPDTREFMRRSSTCHSQIVITTEADEPWTILSFNDFASSVFGYPDSKFSSLGIIDLIKYDRRDWLRGMLAKESLSSLSASIPPSAVPSRGFRRIRSTYEMFNLVDKDRKGPLNETSPLVMSSSRHSSARLWPIERSSSRSIPLCQPSESDGIFVSKSNSRLTSASTTCLDKLGSSSPERRSSSPKSAFESRSVSESHSNSFRLAKRQRVLLCGEVLPILKSSGKWSTASFWVKLKDNRLIWIIEEIQADVAYITVDNTGTITDQSLSVDDILSNRATTSSTPSSSESRQDISSILPTLPRGASGNVDVESVSRSKYFTARQGDMDPVPCTLDINTTALGNSEATRIRVISLANIAGIMIIDPDGFCIKSFNRAFTSALFGVSELAGQPLTQLIPSFQELTRILKSTNEHSFTSGSIISEQAIRKAAALLLLGKGFQIDSFLRLPPVEARHRDGSILKIDIQLRVVEESAQLPFANSAASQSESSPKQLKTFYALWISHSRRRHGFNDIMDTESQLSLFNQHLNINQPVTTDITPTSPFDTNKKRTKFYEEEGISPLKELPGTTSSDKPDPSSESEAEPLPQNNIERLEAESQLLRSASLGKNMGHKRSSTTTTSDGSIKIKKDIHDFVVLENMGEGAYGQVKLAQYRSSAAKSKKVVLKYVIKKRILVDTWTRDRKLGTIPLEIHVLMFLRMHAHYAIVQMLDFFEDDVNYYIEMEPHGIPGMDLFDYIELKPSMDEVECKSLFFQVVAGVRHLHSLDIVHRDIKDENIILDELGRIKLIDFGSAAYCKHGPFDVFVGTIDYAAPEILSGKHYTGKPQDIWALGVLLYTMVYKENPFYNVDEIMEADIRVPFKMSSSSIDLIRRMLDRNLHERATIDEVAEHDWLSDASMVSSDVLSFVNRKAA